MPEPHSHNPGKSEVKADVPQENLVGSMLGRFLIEERLGGGGMGAVYRALDPVLKRSVALKRISPQFRADKKYRDRFLKEAERASSLTDQHIASIYDVLVLDSTSEGGGEIILVMEFVEGESLRKRMERLDSLSSEEFFNLAEQCAQALIAAHERGILHCDIKPENIMITSAQRVKVLDFGVAKRLPSKEVDATLDHISTTGLGSVSGTPAYMSPEVLLEKPLDQRADIFSLGVVFYEVLSGKNPFHGDTFIATSDHILHDVPPPLSNFHLAPPGVEQIIFKMLAKDREQRYATARDLLHDLRAVQGGAGIQVSSQPPRRLPGVAIATWIAATIFVIVAVAGIFLLHRTRSNGVALAGANQIAILPFKSVGADPNARAFSDGLTETLTAKLTQLTDHYPLQVIPSSEVRGQSVNTAEQAHAAFGVNLVLEGGLEQSGLMVRINYSLVDAGTRRQLRAATLTADASDPFSVQDRVVEGATNMLNLELGPQQRTQLTDHGTTQPAAYDLYLRGRGYLQDYAKPEAVDTAIADFSSALERDPNFALAYAGLGESYWHKYEHTHAPELLEKSKLACERAVSLGPRLANGNNCLGMVYTKTGRYEEAIQQFDQALKLDPTSDDAYRGLAFADEHLGKLADAEATYRRAISVRPNYWASYNWLGRFYVTQGRYQDAEKMFKQVIALAPDSFRGYNNLGGNYLSWGRYSDAAQALEKSVAIRPNASALNNLGVAYFYAHEFPDAARAYERALALDGRDYRLLGNLGECYDRIPGKQVDAVAKFRLAIDLGEKEAAINPRDTGIFTNLALYYANLELKTKALELLQRALEHSAQSKNTETLLGAALVYARLNDENRALDYLQQAFEVGLTVDRVAHLPNFDKMSANPRFRALLQKANPQKTN